MREFIYSMSAPWECLRCGRIFNDLTYITCVGTCQVCFETEMAAEKEQEHQRAMRDLQERQVALLESLMTTGAREDARAVPIPDVAQPEELGVEIKTAAPHGDRAADVGSGHEHRQVLERWTQMLEEMIEPEDQVAQMVLYEAALEDFEKRGIDLAELQDIDDRRRCNKIVKMARKALREASDDVRRDLKAFKDAYDAYSQSFERGCEPFTLRPSPPWVPNDDAPKWIPGEPLPPWDSRPSPEWVPGVEPQLDLLPIPGRPREVPPPGPRPSFNQLRWPGHKYAQTASDTIYHPEEVLFENATVELLVELGHERTQAQAIIQADGQPFVNGEGHTGRYVDVNPDNGWPITIDNVPSIEGTGRRFPRGHERRRRVRDEAERWDICRAYEQALRDWAVDTKAYDAYLQAVSEWEAASRRATTENERIMAEGYPRQLLAFQEAEARRKDEWREACKVHVINEENRRAIWQRKCEEHQKAEARRKEDWEKESRAFADREDRRKEQWEDACRKHEDAEKNRLNAWIAEWRGFAATVKAHGEAINAFLDEHPDVETLRGKVNAERDLAKLKQSLLPPGMDFPDDSATEPSGKRGRAEHASQEAGPRKQSGATKRAAAKKKGRKKD